MKRQSPNSEYEKEWKRYNSLKKKITYADFKQACANRQIVSKQKIAALWKEFSARGG